MKINMKIFFAALCLFTSDFSSMAQTGFFLIVPNKENCSHLIKTVDFRQEYCITADPIISGKEFQVEGNLQYDLLHENQFFSLRLTTGGLETLRLICTNLPEKQLVLVVNGKAAGLYNNKNFKPAQLMSISGKADSKEFNWVYDNLRNKN
jgi:hypothetical protein